MPKQSKCWEGKKFHRLLILAAPDYSDYTNNGPQVRCLCDCGEEFTTRLYPLKGGRVKSCGCLRAELLKERQATGVMRPRMKDRTDERRGKLTFLRPADRDSEVDKDYGVAWWVRCDCGDEFVTRGTTKSKACRACSAESMRGENSPRWKGGRHVTPAGYVMVTRKDHPRAGKQGYVLEHILVAEGNIGRRLLDGETVHHINGVRDDNRPENLEVWDQNHPAGQRIEDKISFYEEQLLLKLNSEDLRSLASRLEKAADKSRV